MSGQLERAKERTEDAKGENMNCAWGDAIGRAMRASEKLQAAQVMLKTSDGYGVYESRRVRLFRRGGPNYSEWVPTTPTEEAKRSIPVGWWFFVDKRGRILI